MAMNHWYQSMYQMFELVSDFIEAWLCYGFVGLFLPDRVRGKVLFFILSLVLVGSVRAMDILGIDPMISTLWFVFYICMTTVVLFQVNLFYAVSLVSFYILCLYVINYFCMSVMGVIAGNRQFAQFILNQLSLLRCIYLRIPLFCFCYICLSDALLREGCSTARGCCSPFPFWAFWALPSCQWSPFRIFP